MESQGINYLPTLNDKRTDTRTAEAGKAANTLGGNVDSLQKKLIDAIDNGAGEGVIKKLEIQYNAAVRALESFMQLMKNMHEMLMSGIRRLDIRG
jgi:hypothetical protein